MITPNRALALIGLALFAAFLSPSAAYAIEKPGADWPQLLGPTRDGVYCGPALASEWAPGGPAVVWKRDVGQGFAAPVVAGKRVLLFERVQDQARLESLDARTGKLIWTAQYPTGYQDDLGFDEGPRATPTVADGRIFTFGAEGSLRAWAQDTGKALWAVDTRDKFGSTKGYFGSACSPLVEANAVIVNVGGKAGAGIVAFDAATGRVLWQATDDAAGYSSPVVTTVGGKRVCFVFTRAGLVALDPAKGKVYYHIPWRSRQDASVNAATPLVIGDRLFVSASYGTGAMLLQLDAKDPTKQPPTIWSGDHILSNHYATSVANAGFLYGFDGRQDQAPGPSLRCVDASNGKVKWNEDAFGAGTILRANDKLLILRERGELMLLNATPTQYQPLAKAQVLGFGVRAYPALANGFLYARDKTRLICLDLRKK